MDLFYCKDVQKRKRKKILINYGIILRKICCIKGIMMLNQDSVQKELKYVRLMEDLKCSILAGGEKAS